MNLAQEDNTEAECYFFSCNFTQGLLQQNIVIYNKIQRVVVDLIF